MYIAKYFQRNILLIILFLTSILITVWAIPHTIGLRYITSLVLIGLMILVKPNLAGFLKKQPILIILNLYLFIHIFFISDDFSLSIKSFNQEWLKFLIFNLLGASLGIYLSKSNPKDLFLWLGAAFSIPLLFHIFLFLLKSVRENSIPFGYSGLSISHGDLGYTALQASIFLSIYIFSEKVYSLKKFAGSTLLLFCFLSPYLAQSRGGLIFVFLSTLFVTTIFFLSQNKFFKPKTVIISLIITVLICILSVKVISMSLSEKWLNIDQKIEVGLIGNPILIMCNGTEDIYSDLHEKKVPITPQLVEIINDVNAGTASRVTVARAGLQLLFENPMGLYGSKNAYQLAISSKCEPAIKMSNTHNGWLDLALAIGLPGLVIFLLLYFNYFWVGVKAFRNKDPHLMMFGIGILATSVIWVFRGFLDATSRDQMLEMQSFCLAFFAGAIFSQHSRPKE